MKKSKRKKSIPKLEYLQDPKTLETPKLMKPLYKADEKLRKSLQPKNLKKEAKEFGKYIKKNLKTHKNEKTIISIEKETYEETQEGFIGVYKKSRPGVAGRPLWFMYFETDEGEQKTIRVYWTNIRKIHEDFDIHYGDRLKITSKKDEWIIEKI